MEELLYLKSLEEQELLIIKNENGITGAWMKEDRWVSDVDIEPLHLESYPIIMEHLESEENLILGFSLHLQVYYAMLMGLENGVVQHITGLDTKEILNILNTNLIRNKESLSLNKKKVLNN